MELLIGLALLWVLWLVPPKRWKRSFRGLIVTIATILIVLSPVGLNIALWVLGTPLPGDSGDPVDAIVVLGRGESFRALRTATVVDLWRANRAPRIFASGMLDARAIAQTLKEMGVPATQLSGEECSQSTLENAQFTTALLHPQGVKKILLVTDRPHMLRSLLMFRSFGFQVIPHPTALPKQLPYSEKFPIALREYTGLMKYLITGQFQSRSPEALINPPPEIEQKIREWNCRV